MFRPGGKTLDIPALQQDASGVPKSKSRGKMPQENERGEASGDATRKRPGEDEPPRVPPKKVGVSKRGSWEEGSSDKNTKTLAAYFMLPSQGRASTSVTLGTSAGAAPTQVTKTSPVEVPLSGAAGGASVGAHKVTTSRSLVVYTSVVAPHPSIGASRAPPPTGSQDVPGALTGPFSIPLHADPQSFPSVTPALRISLVLLVFILFSLYAGFVGTPDLFLMLQPLLMPTAAVFWPLLYRLSSAKAGWESEYRKWLALEEKLSAVLGEVEDLKKKTEEQEAK